MIMIAIITTAQHLLSKSELRFCTVSNPTRDVPEVSNFKNLLQWSRLEISQF